MPGAAELEPEAGWNQAVGTPPMRAGNVRREEMTCLVEDVGGAAARTDGGIKVCTEVSGDIVLKLLRDCELPCALGNSPMLCLSVDRDCARGDRGREHCGGETGHRVRLVRTGECGGTGCRNCAICGGERVDDNCTGELGRSLMSGFSRAAATGGGAVACNNVRGCAPKGLARPTRANGVASACTFGGFAIHEVPVVGLGES